MNSGQTDRGDVILRNNWAARTARDHPICTTPHIHSTANAFKITLSAMEWSTNITRRVYLQL